MDGVIQGEERRMVSQGEERLEESPGEERLLISVREAAAKLGIGRDTAYRLVREGRLPSVRLGRRCLVPANMLAVWVDSEARLTNDSSLADATADS